MTSQALVLIAGTVIALKGWVTPFGDGAVLPLAFTLIAARVFLVVRHQSRKRLVIEMLKADFTLCPECAYDLRQIELSTDEAVGRCPECGALVDFIAARKLWNTWANMGR